MEMGWAKWVTRRDPLLLRVVLSKLFWVQSRYGFFRLLDRVGPGQVQGFCHLALLTTVKSVLLEYKSQSRDSCLSNSV